MRGRKLSDYLARRALPLRADIHARALPVEFGRHDGTAARTPANTRARETRRDSGIFSRAQSAPQAPGRASAGSGSQAPGARGHLKPHGSQIRQRPGERPAKERVSDADRRRLAHTGSRGLSRQGMPDRVADRRNSLLATPLAPQTRDTRRQAPSRLPAATALRAHPPSGSATLPDFPADFFPLVPPHRRLPRRRGRPFRDARGGARVYLWSLARDRGRNSGPGDGRRCSCPSVFVRSHPPDLRPAHAGHRARLTHAAQLRANVLPCLRVSDQPWRRGVARREPIWEGRPQSDCRMDGWTDGRKRGRNAARSSQRCLFDGYGRIICTVRRLLNHCRPQFGFPAPSMARAVPRISLHLPPCICGSGCG